ncbi:MAG: hypothetical protein FJW77_12820 [Actinobacteria bacterium]|nr:hypothetical protein [Actinomycetota bacterium]
MTGRPDVTLTGLVGVYDADHTLRGELSYWVGARLGRAHCALCDVTHGALRPTRAWREYRASLPVPFTTRHRDDAPAAVRALGPPPLVAAETATGPRLLLGPDELARCGGSVAALGRAIATALAAHGLRWPETAGVTP